MNRYPFVTIVLLAAACGKDSSGPAGIDPTVLIDNRMPQDSVFFTWRDGQGIVSTDTIFPNHQFCERFIARPDSAYFEAIVNYHATNGNTYVSTYTQPWFDPVSRGAWTMDVAIKFGGADIAVRDVSPTLPC